MAPPVPNFQSDDWAVEMIPTPILIKLITPQPGKMTTRLPGKSARVNAALIAGCSVEGCDRPVLTKALCGAHYHRQRKHGTPTGGGVARGEIGRFINETVLPWPHDECLAWPYARNNMGYGVVSVNRRMVVASRRICELAHGAPSAPEMEAAHICGKGHEGCVNPRHLAWKSRVENAADQLVHGTRMRGVKNPSAKLSEKQVLEIRALDGVVPKKELAKRFGVSEGRIGRIQKRTAWSWL